MTVVSSVVRVLLLAAAAVAAVTVLLIAPVGAAPPTGASPSTTVDPSIPDSPSTTADASTDVTDVTDVTDDEPGLDERIQILGVDESEDVVTLDIAVPPAIGRLEPVAANFGVTDGGELVDVSVSSIGTTTDTILVIDTSGSMQGPALQSATAAAARFIESLPPDVRVGLISFDDVVTTHRTPTADRAAVLTDLDGLTAGGAETVLWDALVVAAELANAPGAELSSVVVLSDGDDTASAASRSRVADAFETGPAVLYAVAIESPDTNLAALEGAVDLIGGQFLATTDVGQLDQLYTDIAGRLANRYQLRFVPATEGTRTVVISVAAGSGLATASVVLPGLGSGPVVGGTTVAPGGPAPMLNVDDHPALGVVASPMLPPWSDRRLLLFGLAAIFSSLVIGGYLLVRPASQVRIHTAAVASTDRIGGVNQKLGRAADRLVSDYDQKRKIDAKLEAADLNLRPGEFILAWSVATAVASLGVMALGGLLYGIAVVPMAVAGTMIMLNVRTNRRRARFADQLTETLGIMASSLRSGQSLPRSIELVAAEALSPTAEEFHRISFETRVGRDLTDSMREASERMGSPDLEWLAQAVDINREMGGDLTEILDNVASTIRERRTVSRQIQALSSEGRATGWVLLGLPVVLFLFSWWRTPDSIDALVTEPIGRIMLGIALTGMTVGHVWIRKLVRLKF